MRIYFSMISVANPVIRCSKHLVTSTALRAFVRGVLLLVILSGCSQPPETIYLKGQTMGTTYSVVVAEPPETLRQEVLSGEIEGVLQRVNQGMSTYIPDSELSRFNALQDVEPVRVSSELSLVIRAAQNISEKTDGRYDVTVGPLVNLWGFGPNPYVVDKVPSQEDILNAKANVGFRHLEVNLENDTLRKKRAGLYVDLSSIAKGYGVDAISELLNEKGVASFLVEIGGEIRAKGKSPRGDSWKIGIEKPQSSGRAVQQVVPVEDIAVATSGDYRNYFEKDGVRYSHTIDALTGNPITHHLVSVTVLADGAMIADGWATALSVLGEKEGYDLATKEGLSAYFIYRENEEFKIKLTELFSEKTGINLNIDQ